MNKSSLFASIPGLFLLFVLLIASAYFGAHLITALLLLTLVFGALSRLWSRSVLKSTEASIVESHIACHEGEAFELTLLLRNRSFFPLIWLDAAVPLAIDQAPKVIREGDDPRKRLTLPYERPVSALCERIVWFLWQQEITCTERMTALARGIVPLDRVSLQAGDGLGLAACQRWAKLKNPSRITVYPRLVPVDIGPFLRLIQDAEAGARGQTEDVTLLRGSRPYSHGDPMRRINWRRLAMSGVMETNQYETITPGCISFLLDLGSFGYEEIINQDAATKSGGTVHKTVHQAEMERMISAVASLICALHERRQRFALVIPGYDEREAVICRPASGETALLQALEALAGIDYRGGEAKLPMEELHARKRRLGVVHLCALSENGTQMQLLEAMGFAHARSIVCRQSAPEEADGRCVTLERIVLCPDAEGGAP